MKQLLDRNLTVFSQLLALVMVISATASLQPRRATAAGMENWGDPTRFFQSFADLSQSGETEADLMKVTSDALDGFLILKVVLDANYSLQKLKYVTSDKVVFDMPLNDLAKGVILMKSGKYDVLKLVGPELNPDTGGNLDLVYLTNGVWNNYNTFNMSLVRSGQVWTVQTRENNRPAVNFNTMYLKKKSFLGKTIGIESVTVGNANP
jgi:hypothetical protein